MYCGYQAFTASLLGRSDSVIARGHYRLALTCERGRSAIPDQLPAQIGCRVALINPWVTHGRAVAVDSTVLSARSGVWRKYQLALLYRFEHGLSLNVGLEAFMQAV